MKIMMSFYFIENCGSEFCSDVTKPNVFVSTSNKHAYGFCKGYTTNLTENLPDTTVLHIDGNPVTTISSNYSKNLPALTNISINYSEIKSTIFIAFGNFSSNQALRIIHNKIRIIQAGAFPHIGTLPGIHLEHTTVQELGTGIFDAMYQLTTLHLNQNTLQTLETDVSSGLSSLQELFLQNIDRVKIPPGLYTAMPNLLSLDLSNNKISSISPGTFSGLSRTELSNVDDNFLQVIYKNAFSGLTSVLSINLLTTIEPFGFSSLPNTDEVWLLGNKVIEFSNASILQNFPLTGAFSIGGKVNISGNNLICNYSLGWCKTAIARNWFETDDFQSEMEGNQIEHIIIPPLSQLKHNNNFQLNNNGKVKITISGKFEMFAFISIEKDYKAEDTSCCLFHDSRKLTNPKCPITYGDNYYGAEQVGYALSVLAKVKGVGNDQLTISKFMSIGLGFLMDMAILWIILRHWLLRKKMTYYDHIQWKLYLKSEAVLAVMSEMLESCINRSGLFNSKSFLSSTISRVHLCDGITNRILRPPYRVN